MIVDVRKLHEALDNVHKDVAVRNAQARIRARQEHNAKTQVLLLNINIGGIAMDIVNSKWRHK